ncbi:DUF190 domain-containing protein [Geomonas sp. Red32]|uniref:DUF190 domain-containing protein n=1 Tax=Geomonas sp. Red32 TaxID=2912856 RepID=UPI00202CDF19|nr:DUF190 domain-containing protein [Geomonas sp. Red32]MCM0080013.1 DUF190 domain-containing protein [Geomonas sp. Red32]
MSDHAEAEELTLIRVFIGEGDRLRHIPLYEALVEMLRKEGFAGATVLRGIAGFGPRGGIHSERLLRLSSDLPVVVEVIDEPAKCEAVIPKIEEMLDGGLITTESITVRRYARKSAP